MHPDYDRYVRACDYPGVLDEAAVERHLAAYLSALGVQRKIVRLRAGWTLEKHPSLNAYVGSVLAYFDQRAAQDARDAQAAQAAQAARAARSSHRFAAWCMSSCLWYREMSWVATTWLGARTADVKAWAQPAFEAYINGCWLLHWTEDVLYWVAKPSVHTERVRDGRRLHCEDGPAFRSDIEDLYFWHGVLVSENVVMHPERLTVQDVRAEMDVEAQRIMIERMGPGKYLEACHAKLIDMDSLTLVGSAPRALMEDDLGNRWLVGTDGSTARVYHMAVPREAGTCREAHTMIAGFDEFIAEA